MRVFDRSDSDSTESDDGKISADGGTPVEREVTPDDPGGFSWKMGITAGIMALIIGAFAAWATSTMGFAVIAFAIAAGGSTYFLYQKRIPSEAIGSGLYITALLMVLTPLLFYIPTIISSGEGEGAEAAGTFIGSVMGLVIWGFAFLLFAIVTAAIGYFFKRRTRKKLDS
jgi:hypothetical protein